MINVSYSSSDSYAWIMCTSLTSLLENNKESIFNIYLFSNKISKTNLDKIRMVVARYKAKLIIIDIASYSSNFKNISINARWDFATFGRLFEPIILDNSVEKIINIDCDTIVLGNIEELWNSMDDTKMVGGVSDCLNVRYVKSIGAYEPNILLNAGITIFNLKLMREMKVFDNFDKYIKSHRRILYLDQDVLNACIPADLKFKLPLKFNVYSLLFYLNYKNINVLRRPYNFYSANEVKAALEKPFIIHFTTSNFDYGRPWYTHNKHPKRYLFLSYLNMTPFYDHKLLDNKPSAIFRVVKILPLFFKLRFMYFINGFLKPVFLKNK